MAPVRFAFGVHDHQPVGNFDHIVEQHVREAYRPFLERLTERGFTPFTLHVSGPLLAWLEAHDHAFLDLIGRLAADGKVELLLSGYDEPILASLSRDDRVEQVVRMREELQRLFGGGLRTEGLWLTERVWEPDLAADLAEAGVHYCLVDDRHFLVSAIPRERLHAPWWTEAGGRKVALFPIDERLRYLVPFKPPAQVLGYLEHLRAAGHALAVLADDGEKFGGWPGTREWVYERGWLREFLDVMLGAVERGEVRLVTFGQALDECASGGLAYVPAVSYREMEKWALPPEAVHRLEGLEREMGEHRLAGPDAGLVRGAHWRNFLVRYPEANRMHKKALALSALRRARERQPGAGDLAEARRAIGRAQCNDAYWHGVFGGLYLPWLRNAIWRNLALAERLLRRGEPLEAELADVDYDGRDEVHVHSAAASVVVAPARGGAVEEYTLFATLTNYADTLTRRHEAYHDAPPPHHGAPPPPHETPAYDREDRALFVDRVVPADVAREVWATGQYAPLRTWARTPLTCRLDPRAGSAEVVMEAAEPRFEKRIRIAADGALTVAWRWDPAGLAPGSRFATELSLAGVLDLRAEPAAEEWRFPIETVAKSERGLERTVQGESVTLLWPADAGAARVTVSLPRGGPAR